MIFIKAGHAPYATVTKATHIYNRQYATVTKETHICYQKFSKSKTTHRQALNMQYEKSKVKSNESFRKSNRAKIG